MRRGLVLAVAMAIGVVTVGVVSAAGGSSGRPPLRAWGFGFGHAAHTVVIPHIKRAQTFVLRAHDFIVTAVDNPPLGTSQGDELAVEGLLATRHGEGAGRLDAHEVFTGLSSNGGRLELLFTALLAHGQISSVGVIRINQSGATDTRAAIIGGTGRYRNARGEVIIHPAGQTTRLTFVLLP